MPGKQCPLPEKQCLRSNLPGFTNKTRTSLISPSFTYTKHKPGCQGHVALFLTSHKQILQVNISFLQTKGATPCSLKTPERDMVHLQSLTLSGSC
jgi:hypothetical protein